MGFALSGVLGNSRFEFMLNKTQQNAATAAGAFSSSSNLVGLSALVINAAGGPEIFYLFNANAGEGGVGGGGAVPEPSSILLCAMGILLLGSSVMWRKFRSVK
jgi:hypothetical protein